MKLIIEIDETDYRQIRAFDEGVTAYQLTLRLYDAVSNGTPLDDIKAEIEKKCEAFEKCDAYECANGLNWALKVIDKHMAERSE